MLFLFDKGVSSALKCANADNFHRQKLKSVFSVSQSLYEILTAVNIKTFTISKEQIIKT